MTSDERLVAAVAQVLIQADASIVAAMAKITLEGDWSAITLPALFISARFRNEEGATNLARTYHLTVEMHAMNAITAPSKQDDAFRRMEDILYPATSGSFTSPPSALTNNFDWFRIDSQFDSHETVKREGDTFVHIRSRVYVIFARLKQGVDSLGVGMADITGTARLTLAKNSNPSIVISISDTQVGSKYESGVQSIGTSEEQLSKNDVGTIGYLGINNLDETNYVEIGATTGVYTSKIKALCGALIPWDGSTVYAKANTGACSVEYLLVEA